MNLEARTESFTDQIIAGYMDEASREVLATLIRAAYSLNVKERHDCSSSILDATGGTAALTAHGGIHLGSMLGLVENVLKTFPTAQMHDGDIFLVNDPYGGGGSHLPDFTMAMPVIIDGEVLAFVANIAHQSDIGGANAGSISGNARDIFAEGLRLPAVRLRDGDRLNEDLLRVIYQNSRMPEERRGDINAQIGSLTVGLRRMRELAGKYGFAQVVSSMEALSDYSERRIRSSLRDIPDGVYAASDWLDADEQNPAPVPLRVTLTVEGDRCCFDFEGTGDQLPSARNVPTTALLATVYTVVKQMLDPRLPPNAGYYRAIEVRAPSGCLVNPLPPAAVADRALTCNIVGDVIAGAISKAIPDRAMARSGPYLSTTVSGSVGDGRFFVNFEALAGSEGALAYRDGMDAVRVHASGGLNQSVEAMELAYPVMIEEYGFLTDTGGAGKYRGGLATRRDVRALGDGFRLSASTGRTSVAAAGLNGGGDGHTASVVVNPGGPDQRRPGQNFSGHTLSAGEVVSVITPSGGGYGDPFARDPAAVLRDVLEEKVSAAQALGLYGVVIVDGEVDLRATEIARRDPNAERGLG